MEELRRNSLERRVPTESGPTLLHEAKNILEDIDLKTLQDIFQELKRKSQVPESNEIVDADSVVLNAPEEGAMGTYANGKIYLFPEELCRQASERETTFGNQVVSAFIHEKTHAESHNIEGQVPTDIWTELKDRALSHIQPRTYKASGFDTTEARGGTIRRSQFNFLNEAVTDLLAEEVFTEYKKRTGTTNADFESYSESYLPQKALLESFIGHIANATSVPTEIIWKSLQQGYFAGVNLADTELSELYEELVLAQIFEEVRKVKNLKEIFPLVQKMNIENVSDDAKARILRGMESYQNLVSEKLSVEDDPDFKEMAASHYHESQDAIQDVKKRLGL